MSAKATTRIVRATTVTAVAIASFLGGPTALAVAANPISTENALPGTTAWEPHSQGLANADQHALEGYASEVSVQPGETVHLHVSTNPVARYRVEVYRLGWYGGTGGRLVGCIPSCRSDKQGTAYSIPALDANGFVDPGVAGHGHLHHAVQRRLGGTTSPSSRSPAAASREAHTTSL